MNPYALDLIKKFEGCSLRAYKDSGGVWTIGYGSTDRVTPDETITPTEAERRLEDRLEAIEKEIDPMIKFPLSQRQMGACLSLTYNIGVKAFSRSTVLRMINMAKLDEVGKSFLLWTYVKGQFCEGLLNRRRAEKDLFNFNPASVS